MKTQIYEWRQALKNITLKNCAITLLGSFILAFGLYNVHSISGVTEGGVLGATLLLEHWTGISPAFTGGIMNILCYILGWKLLGKEFIAYSALATAGFSGTYKICEQFPHLWPELANMPLLAALVGALFVGVGAGLCVRIGGAPSGDDALAMSISHATGWKIQWVYLMSDLIVLVMSLSYIPVRRIGYSLFTVLMSGQLIGLIQNFGSASHSDAEGLASVKLWIDLVNLNFSVVKDTGPGGAEVVFIDSVTCPFPGRDFNIIDVVSTDQISRNSGSLINCPEIFVIFCVIETVHCQKGSRPV